MKSDGRLLKRFTRIDLRTRIMLGAVLAVVVTTLGMALTGSFFVKRTVHDQISQEEFVRVSSAAQQIDERFEARLQILNAAAQALKSLGATTSGQAQAYMDASPAVKSAFDNIGVLDSHGLLVANSKPSAAVGKLDVHDRPYFVTTMASRHSVISEPIKNRASGLPQVVLTAPVFDRDGNIVFMLTGAIDLDKQKFFENIVTTKIGRTGYVFVIDTNGTVINHPRHSLILKNVNSEGGTNLATEQALHGLEGTTEAMNRYGVYGLYAYKRTKSTNWIVGAIYPAVEAYEPAAVLERTSWLLAAGLAVIAALLSVWFLRSTFAPLSDFMQRIAGLSDADEFEPMAPGLPADEVGRLASAFDGLMNRLRETQTQVRLSERRLRTIADSMPALIGYIDTQLTYTFANARYEEWFGEKPRGYVGLTIAQTVPADTYARAWPNLRRALDGEEIVYENSAQTRAGIRHVRVHYVPDVVDGRVAGIYVLTVDKTQEQSDKLRIEASERMFRAVTDNLPALITYVDSDERIQVMNATFTSWVGIDTSAAIGKTLEEVLGPVLYEQRRADLKAALGGERREFDTVSLLAAGVRHLHSVYLPDIRDDGSVAGLFSISMDISEVMQVQAELERQAFRDTLTGLPNRRAFNAKLASAVNRCVESSPMAVMFIDIDYFKAVNDTMGHAAGDAVLKAFAQRIAEAVRSTDTTARISGDEFVVLLEAVSSRSEVERIARKICLLVAQPVWFGESEVQVTASVGVVFSDGKRVPTAPELLAAADSALYSAKEAGRNQFRIFD